MLSWQILGTHFPAGVTTWDGTFAISILNGSWGLAGCMPVNVDDGGLTSCELQVLSSQFLSGRWSSNSSDGIRMLAGKN